MLHAVGQGGVKRTMLLLFNPKLVNHSDVHKLSASGIREINENLSKIKPPAQETLSSSDFTITGRYNYKEIILYQQII